MHKTTLSQFRDILQRLELPPDPIVIVHSSLLKFGLVEGGPKGLTELLKDWLGASGTLIMPTFSFSYGRSRLWKSNETPSECGALTEYFRKRSDVRRTLHPFHSLGVLGKYQNEICEQKSLSSFGSGSPFDWLLQKGAFNLSLGTEFEGGATFLHHTEEELLVPYRYYKEFPGEVLDENENSISEVFKMYVRVVNENYEYENIWDHVWDDLQKQKCFTTFKLNGGNIFWTSVPKTHQVFRKLLLANPFYPARMKVISPLKGAQA